MSTRGTTTTMDSTLIDVETHVYDDRGGVQSEVVISIFSIEFIVVVDKPFRVKKRGVEVSEELRAPRVFWRKRGDTQPRGQLA